MMNILFRADSSSTIGTGHIMRDLVLAEQFQGAHIIFATQDLSGNINHKIKEKDYGIEILNSNDIEEVVELIKKYDIDMIVIDHYGMDYSYEKMLKEKTSVKIFVLDDTYEKHYCDILLNHNIGADETRYKSLVSESCELRCGAKYTLLREEFLQAKKRKKVARKNKTIFLSMGGSDAFNFNLKILKKLKKYRNIQVSLATTTANRNLPQLTRFAFQNKWVKLHVNANNIANLMAGSDFAIITPSVTVNEALYLKLPFITLKVIDNQEDIHKYLKKKRFLAIDKISYLEKQLRKLIHE